MIVEFFSDEIVLWEAKGITLTDYRIRVIAKRFGQRSLKSIMLEHVTSCSLNFTHYPIVLIIAILISLFAFWPRLPRDAAISTLLIGISLIVAYAMTRKTEIIIASPSIEICIDANRKGFDEASELIDEVEKAVRVRVSSLAITMSD